MCFSLLYIETVKMASIIFRQPFFKISTHKREHTLCSIFRNHKGFLVIDVLIHAGAAGLPYLKAGEPMKHFVGAVRDYFRREGLSEYDVYPPLHGIGCAEAESPYPDENTEDVFEAGMTCNTRRWTHSPHTERPERT